MAIQDVVNQVKDRLQTAGEQAQAVAKAAFEANKKAFEVVSSGVEALAKAQSQAAKDLFAEAKESFNKAKTAGVKAVAEKPVDFLPSKQRAIDALNEGKTLVLKTKDELVAVVKQGAEDIKGTVKPAPKKTATAKKTGAKRSVAKAA